IRRRARGARRRRRAAVWSALTAAGAAAVAAALVLPGLALPEEPPRDVHAAATRSPAPGKERFTEPDGTVYHWLGRIRVNPPTQLSASIEVPLSGKPLAVRMPCVNYGSALQPTVTVSVPGVATPFTVAGERAGYSGCEHSTPVDVQPLPATARTATINVEAYTAHRPVSKKKPSLLVTVDVYEWTPPAVAAPAPPPPKVPRSLLSGPEGKILAKQSITWPQAREITLDVPYTKKVAGLVIACSGGIAHRSRTDVWVNGRKLPDSFDCNPPPKDGGYPFAILRPDVVAGGGRLKVQVQLRTDRPEYLRRSGSMTVAVYGNPFHQAPPPPP
ncbi:hypothetical protein, partial [Sinosporangium siamense]